MADQGSETTAGDNIKHVPEDCPRVVNDKTNDASSAATTVADITSIEHIRDAIMQRLPYIDVTNYQVAIGSAFSRENNARYHSLFRYVIADRQRLLRKADEGYTFTLISPNLSRMATSGLDSLFDFPGLDQLNMTLTVTKCDRFVHCGEEFLPLAKFVDPADESYATDEEMDKEEPCTRVVTVYRSGGACKSEDGFARTTTQVNKGTVISIRIPLLESLTTSFKFLNDLRYKTSFGTESERPVGMTQRGILRNNRLPTTEYVHFLRGGCGIRALEGLDVIGPESDLTFDGAWRNVFSVNVAGDWGCGHKFDLAVFRIDRWEGDGRGIAKADRRDRETRALCVVCGGKPWRRYQWGSACPDG